MRILGESLLRVVASYVAIPLALILVPVFLFTQDVSVFDNLVNFIMGGKNKL